MRSFSESANGQEVTVRVDERFEVALSENPTTGYRWRIVDSAPAICTLTRDHFAAARKLPGSGGAHRWIFRAVNTGEATIEMEKARKFETAGTVEHFRLSVRVLPR